MADVQGPFELSLRECREMYVSQFRRSIPGGTTFTGAAQEVYDTIGPAEFGKLLQAVRELHEGEDTNKAEIGEQQ